MSRESKGRVLPHPQKGGKKKNQMTVNEGKKEDKDRPLFGGQRVWTAFMETSRFGTAKGEKKKKGEGSKPCKGQRDKASGSERRKKRGHLGPEGEKRARFVDEEGSAPIPGKKKGRPSIERGKKKPPNPNGRFRGE